MMWKYIGIGLGVVWTLDFLWFLLFQSGRKRAEKEKRQQEQTKQVQQKFKGITSTSTATPPPTKKD